MATEAQPATSDIDAGVSYLFHKDLLASVARHRSRASTPLPLKEPPHLRYWDETAGRFDWIAALPSTRFYVLAHGSKDGCYERAVPATPDGKYDVYPVEKLAADIKAHAEYDQLADVLLITSEIALGDYPQKLAKALGQRVLGPKDKLPPALFGVDELLDVELYVFRP